MNSALTQSMLITELVAHALSHDLDRVVMVLGEGRTQSAGELRDLISRFCQAFTAMSPRPMRAAVIAKNLSQDRARVAQVAQDLNLTQRTLQRKLNDADTSFQQVLDRTRQDLAQDYLRQRGLSLAEIAFLLGFQNQSAFNHAFKEWTGVSPGSYRDSLGGL